MDLHAFHGHLNRIGNLLKMGNQAGGLILRVILPEGDKVVVFPRQKSANVLCRTRQTVVGETATMTGRPFRRWDFAAMVTGVSAMELLSFARVLPVQGAMTSASRSFFGPMGSASAMEQMGSTPVMAVTFS